MTAKMTVEDIIEALGGAKEVAHIVGCSRITVWKWIKNQSIPVHRWRLLLGKKMRTGEVCTLNTLYTAQLHSSNYSTQKNRNKKIAPVSSSRLPGA